MSIIAMLPRGTISATHKYERSDIVKRTAASLLEQQRRHPALNLLLREAPLAQATQPTSREVMLRQLQERMGRMEKEISELECQFAYLRSQTADLETELVDIETETKDIETKVSQLETETADLSAIHGGSAGIRSADLKAKMGDLQEQVKEIPLIKERLLNLNKFILQAPLAKYVALFRRQMVKMAAQLFPSGLGLATDASWDDFKRQSNKQGCRHIEDAVVSELDMDLRAWNDVKDWAGKINAWKHESIDPRSDLAWIDGAPRCSPFGGDYELNQVSMRALIEYAP